MPQPLAGTEVSSGGPLPFWSPDGRFIVLLLGWKTQGGCSHGGGAPQTLADAPDPWGWNLESRRKYHFLRLWAGPLHRISGAGGPVTPLRELDALVRELRASSGPISCLMGNTICMSREVPTPQRRASIWASSVRRIPVCSSRASRTLSYSPPGFLIFVRDGTLLAQGFDLGSLPAYESVLLPLPSHGGEKSPAQGAAPMDCFLFPRTGF